MPVIYWLGRRVVIFLLGKVVEHYLGDYTKSIKKVAIGVCLFLAGLLGGFIAAIAGWAASGYTASGIGAIAGTAVVVLGMYLVLKGIRTIIHTIRRHGKLLGGLLGPLLNRRRSAVAQ